MALLYRAIDARGQRALSSYDRPFPTQDFPPTKAKGKSKSSFRLGRLIAIPLHGVYRAQVFVDSDTWRPYRDQFAYLSRTERLIPAEVEALVDKLGDRCQTVGDRTRVGAQAAQEGPGQGTGPSARAGVRDAAYSPSSTSAKSAQSNNLLDESPSKSRAPSPGTLLTCTHVRTVCAPKMPSEAAFPQVGGHLLGGA
jgi:hypothetical protein